MLHALAKSSLTNLSARWRSFALLIVLPLFAAIAWGQEKPTWIDQGVAKAIAPSLVRIETYGEDGAAARNASGFIVGSDGAILTNFHTIQNTRRATVWLSNGDAYDDVSVLAVDKRKDLALLKIKAVNLTPLKLVRSDALDPGYPFYTVAGDASAPQISEEPFRTTRQQNGFRLLELASGSSHANPGSPVVDSHGAAVGIIASNSQPEDGIDLAIPADYGAGMLSSPGPALSLAAVNAPDDPSAASSVSSGATQAANTADSGQPSAQLQSDPLNYLKHQIRVWDMDDAAKELGEPSRHLDAIDIATLDVIGNSYRYKHPIGQFAEIDLTFDQDSKLLSVVYLYPNGMLPCAALREKLGKNFLKFTNPNGNPSYIYQESQDTVSIQTNSDDNVVNIMIW